MACTISRSSSFGLFAREEKGRREGVHPQKPQKKKKEKKEKEDPPPPQKKKKKRDRDQGEEKEEKASIRGWWCSYRDKEKKRSDGPAGEKGKMERYSALVCTLAAKKKGGRVRT